VATRSDDTDRDDGELPTGLPELAGPVLITGGAGYIGSHTARLLRERKVPVVVYDDFSTGHRAVVVDPLVEGSLGDADRLAAAFREHAPRSVIHFAARASVGESVQHPALYWRENVVHTLGLLEAMRAAGCGEIVFSSSCTTFGPPVELPITESHPQAPISPYGHTKLAMEQMIRAYVEAHGFRAAALRYFNAAGASRDGSLGEHHEPETHLIPLILQVALGRRGEIVVFGDDWETRDGTCVRDYVHVEDLADAHARALSALQAGERWLACNLGTGTGHTVREVVEAARRVTGHPIPERVGPRRPGDPAELVSGGRHAAERLGWLPQRTSLDDIVADAWRFLQRHPKGYEG